MRSQLLTLSSLAIDGHSVDCDLTVMCCCRDDPRLPWQGVLVGSTIGGPDWTGRLMPLTGLTDDGHRVQTEVVIETVRLPSGDLRLRGAGPVIVDGDPW
ncbi:MAG: hypothetical protein FJ000_06085 [Actinobacteria bacterium]|nr:hypothetical protein [Actinomycetota bacterium]